MSEILKIENVVKQYPGVTALDNVSISFEQGEIHALMGENGAGKSTLIKLIAGAIEPSAGTIVVDGERFSGITPQIAREKGISVIYQEFNLIPSMSVMENLYIGNGQRWAQLVDYKTMYKEACALFENFGFDIDVRTKVQCLSTGQQQIVEIAKALSRKSKVLIMDEPSAALSTREVEKMFQVVRRLKEEGVTIIYITHRMDEVFSIADRFTVLRDGKFVITDEIKNIDREKLISYMVGRALKETYPPRENEIGETVLKTENLTSRKVSDISFELHKGEILGLAGLVGAGRTELAKLIFGADKKLSGSVYLNGKTVELRSSAEAIEKGIMLIPEDRKTEGLFLENSIDWNTSITIVKKRSRFGVMRKKEIAEIVRFYVDKLRIKTPSLEQKVCNLSGGNQQKVVVAKAMAAESLIMIFDEPTRGIDVGAKQEIYSLMRTMAKSGVAILMISSDMEEILGMSDRILVMHEGVIAGELDRAHFSQENVLDLASGN